MSVTAPPAALPNPASVTSPALAATGPEDVVRQSSAAARGPDRVVFSPGALLRQLLEAPAAALRQLATLLPLVDRAVAADPRNSPPVPLGQLATAVGEAARQVGTGYGALLSEAPSIFSAGPEQPAVPARPADAAFAAMTIPVAWKAAAAPASPASVSGMGVSAGQAHVGFVPDLPAGPEPPALAMPAFKSIEQWRGQASATLRDAADLLQHAEHRLRDPAPLADSLAAGDPPEWPPSPPPFASAETLWALGQVVSAQHQIASALRGVGSPLAPAEGLLRGRFRMERADQAAALAGSVAVLGAALLGLALWLAVGWWLAVAGLAGLLAAVAVSVRWGWRLAVPWRGLRLELRR